MICYCNGVIPIRLGKEFRWCGMCLLWWTTEKNISILCGTCLVSDRIVTGIGNRHLLNKIAQEIRYSLRSVVVGILRGFCSLLWFVIGLFTHTATLSCDCQCGCTRKLKKLWVNRSLIGPLGNVAVTLNCNFRTHFAELWLWHSLQNCSEANAKRTH